MAQIIRPLPICTRCSSPPEVELTFPPVKCVLYLRLIWSKACKKNDEYSKAGIKKAWRLLHLEIQSPCHKEAQAAMWRDSCRDNQDPWLTVSAEIPAKSQHQLASSMSELSWKPILQTQLKHSSWWHMEQRYALSTKSYWSCKIMVVLGHSVLRWLISQ